MLEDHPGNENLHKRTDSTRKPKESALSAYRSWILHQSAADQLLLVTIPISGGYRQI